MTKRYVYICYHYIFGQKRLQFILDSEKEARAWVARNPEYLDYEVHELYSKPYRT